MDPNAVEDKGILKSGLELAKSITDKHVDLLRPATGYYSAIKGGMWKAGSSNSFEILLTVPDIFVPSLIWHAAGAAERDKAKYALIRDPEDLQQGIYDKPLPCFGCGIGWFSFLTGFIFPLIWYFATILYFGNYYRKDPRERSGLAASAIAAIACSVLLLVLVAYYLLI